MASFSQSYNLIRRKTAQTIADHGSLGLVLGLIAMAIVFGAYQVPYAYTFQTGLETTGIFLSDFQPIERAPDIGFRWTGPHSQVTFPAVVQNQAYLLRLRLAAGPRPASAAPPEATFMANGVVVGHLSVKPEWTTYEIQVDPQSVPSQTNLHFDIAVPTFVPRDTIPGSQDERSLGVMVERLELKPIAARPPVSQPPWTQVAGWLLSSYLLLALIWRANSRPSKVLVWSVLAAAELALAIGLTLARPWAASLIWYVAAILAGAGLLARPFVGWIIELRSTSKIPLNFIHTLGVGNRRLRAFLEVALVGLIAVIFFWWTVWPRQSMTMADFLVGYAGARVWLQGGDYYDTAQLQVINPNHSLSSNDITEYTAPPSSLILSYPFAFLPPLQAKQAWLLLSFALMVGSGAFLYSAVRSAALQPPSPVLLALMFTSSGSLVHALDFGQVNIVILFLFSLGIWAWGRRREGIAASSVVAGTALKLFPAIFILYFLLKRSWRTLVLTLTIGAALLLGTLILTGTTAMSEYIFNVLPVAQAHRVSNFDQSTLVFLRRTNHLLGLVPDNDVNSAWPGLWLRLVQLLSAGALLSLSAYWFRQFSKGGPMQEELEFAAVIALAMLILPRMWEHYLMFLIIPFYLILAVLINRPIPLYGQLSLAFVLSLSWVISQYGPNLWNRPGWPPALTSIGLYGTFLVYLCLLYQIRQLSKVDTRVSESWALLEQSHPSPALEGLSTSPE